MEKNKEIPGVNFAPLTIAIAVILGFAMWGMLIYLILLML
jgi:hypothetical protein